MLMPRPFWHPAFLAALLMASGVTLPNVSIAQDARKPAKAAQAPTPADDADEPAGDHAEGPTGAAADDESEGRAGDGAAGTEDVDIPPGGKGPDRAAEGRRSARDIMSDMEKTGRELGEVLDSRESVFDAERRKANAPRAIPPLRRMLALLDELVRDQPEAAEEAGAGDQKWQFLSLLSGFGDREADERLREAAAGDDPQEAAGAKASQLLSRWFRSDSDRAKQERIVIDLSALAQASPESDPVTFAAVMMSQAGAATPQIRDSVQKVITDDLKGPAARQVAEGIRAEQKLRAMEGKPLVLKGTTVDGEAFSTADWKGKVILVNFWATWSRPCLAELPRVKKAYADFHDQGFEILGVSCDKRAEDLENFLKENQDMPWPQLFEREAPGWHPLATAYGVRDIPTMFLIDKGGVVRSVTARKDFEESIPRLLKGEGAAPKAGGPRSGTGPKGAKPAQNPEAAAGAEE